MRPALFSARDLYYRAPMRAVLVAIAVLTMFSCSPENSTEQGFQVLDGSACYTLLLAQCGCCGEGEANCTAYVDYLVSNDKAWTSTSEAVCETDNQLAAEALCARYDSPAKLAVACQGFSPSE